MTLPLVSNRRRREAPQRLPIPLTRYRTSTCTVSTGQRRNARRGDRRSDACNIRATRPRQQRNAYTAVVKKRRRKPRATRFGAIGAIASFAIAGTADAWHMDCVDLAPAGHESTHLLDLASAPLSLRPP